MFPTYRESPLQTTFPRVLAVGDASGIQSPLSFGGFGSLTRHIERIVSRWGARTCEFDFKALFIVRRRIFCDIDRCWILLYLHISPSPSPSLFLSQPLPLCLSITLSSSIIISHVVHLSLYFTSFFFLLLSSSLSLCLLTYNSLNEALVGELISAEHLAMINPYQPNLAACWMFQRAMSVKIGSKPNPGLIVGTYRTCFSYLSRTVSVGK